MSNTAVRIAGPPGFGPRQIRTEPRMIHNMATRAPPFGSLDPSIAPGTGTPGVKRR